MGHYMTNSERIKKAKEELENWIEMHNGIIPSEDLKQFEEDVQERQWFIKQAEKVERYERALKKIAYDELKIGGSIFRKYSWIKRTAQQVLEGEINANS